MIAYAITDPSTLNFQTLTSDMHHFADLADMILYRDKANPHYATDAEIFMAQARVLPFEKVLLHREVALAERLGADGVHLSADQFDEIAPAKRLGLMVIISTHHASEIANAIALGADMVTVSPIFPTPNKGQPLGVEILTELVSQYPIPIIALGGIVSNIEIQRIQASGAKGFASIRYFLKKDRV